MSASSSSGSDAVLLSRIACGLVRVVGSGTGWFISLTIRARSSCSILSTKIHASFKCTSEVNLEDVLFSMMTHGYSEKIPQLHYRRRNKDLPIVRMFFHSNFKGKFITVRKIYKLTFRALALRQRYSESLKRSTIFICSCRRKKFGQFLCDK